MRQLLKVPAAQPDNLSWTPRTLMETPTPMSCLPHTCHDMGDPPPACKTNSERNNLKQRLYCCFPEAFFAGHLDGVLQISVSVREICEFSSAFSRLTVALRFCPNCLFLTNSLTDAAYRNTSHLPGSDFLPAWMGGHSAKGHHWRRVRRQRGRSLCC